MNSPFDSTNINGMTLQNRFVRSATWEGMCDEKGCPTQKLKTFYQDLAKGQIGLIITGYTYIRPDGKQLTGKMGLYSDDYEQTFKELTQAVHQENGKIAIQLVHAGGQTTSQIAGRKPVAPSAVKVDQFPEHTEELSKDEINELVHAFGMAARRAKSYGFDAVQIHGAHGYLVNQFLSPHTNQRRDEYGGSLKNRSRFLMEVYRQIRKEVGDDYPVLIKLNGSDNLPGGLSFDDAVLVAQQLDMAGIDVIEVSSGTSASAAYKPARVKIGIPEGEAYNLDLSIGIKNRVSCPVMVVGGFRSLPVVQKAIQDYQMDYIAMARPLIREPNLIYRWTYTDQTPAKCTSCNKCFLPGLKEGGIYCVLDKGKKA
ncbi:MAG: NADH:flavin oxidoreductase [Marinilabiliaceae bacterium]|nr:NADH:flavin oxidoreductase [Marinilabiliaceae bacterium]